MTTPHIAPSSVTNYGPSMFAQPSMLSMRVLFKPIRSRLVERRDQEPIGVIKIYCKLCQRLIVANRDEFILPIAIRGHKCMRGYL